MTKCHVTFFPIQVLLYNLIVNPNFHMQSASEKYTHSNYDNDNIHIVRKNIDIINNFRHLYYCIKYKAQFRKHLWEKVREPKIIKRYHPSYLIECLVDNEDADANEDADLDKVLEEW